MIQLALPIDLRRTRLIVIIDIKRFEDLQFVKFRKKVVYLVKKK